MELQTALLEIVLLLCQERKWHKTNLEFGFKKIYFGLLKTKQNVQTPA